MKTKAVDNAKLGLFVLAGLLFLIFTLYMIGKNRNLFGSTFTIKASVNNVNGLVAGNNVRYKGIDVGTVKNITFASDTSILVTLVIIDKMRPYIKQNAIASIGTDGLMGNKLININSQPGTAPPVEEGSIIVSTKPIETDEMLRTLNTTNITVERVTRNLEDITEKLNASNSLWDLLADTAITQDLKMAVKDFRQAGSNTAALTGSAKTVINRFSEGNGLASNLFTDTSLAAKVDRSLDKIESASNNTERTIEDIRSVVSKMNQGEGTVGLLLADTTLRNTLLRSATQLEQGTSRFNENMEALKSNFLFRKYFKKLEREKRKAKN